MYTSHPVITQDYGQAILLCYILWFHCNTLLNCISGESPFNHTQINSWWKLLYFSRDNPKHANSMLQQNKPENVQHYIAWRKYAAYVYFRYFYCLFKCIDISLNVKRGNDGFKTADVQFLFLFHTDFCFLFIFISIYITTN